MLRYLKIETSLLSYKSYERPYTGDGSAKKSVVFYLFTGVCVLLSNKTVYLHCLDDIINGNTVQTGPLYRNCLELSQNRACRTIPG